MNKIYLSLLGILVCASLFAQNGTLTGKILDAKTNLPLAGAKIEIKSNGVFTSGSDGVFQIPCNGNTEIHISFLGYEPYQEKIQDCSKNLTIELTPSSDNLDEVQLTGNDGKRQIEKPVSEVQLKPRELKRGTGLFLDDAINSNVPGVTMNRRGVSSGQQFNIRGYGNGVGFKGASNNFDGQGYKVYYNNIPITDAEGVTMLDDIDFGSIGSVDVLKGPAGSLYGFAISGMIDLKTIRPEKGQTSISEKALLGSYGLSRFTTQLQMGLDKTSLLVNYGHQSSDGYIDHNSSNKSFLNAVFDYRPNEKQTISTYFGYSNSYDERGGELTIEQYENKDYSGNPRYIKNNAHSEVVGFRAGLSHEYKFNTWISNTTSLFGSGLSTNSSSAGGWTDKDPVNFGTRSNFDLNFNLGSDFSLAGTVGVEYQQQRAIITGYRMVENPDDPTGYNVIGAIKSSQATVSQALSLFTEWTLNMPYDFSFTAGLGENSQKLHLDDRLYDPESNKNRTVEAKYYHLFSPHFAINKIINNDISVYASYSNAYNAPVTGNIVISTTGQLNTGLVPEEGNQFEIGSKGTILGHKLQYQIALFQAKFKNKFTSVAVPLDVNTTGYTYIANGGQLNNKGLELLLKYDAYQSATGFFSNIRPYANTAYSDFTYENFQYQSLNGDGETVTVDYSGKAVAGVAPWVVNAGIDFNTNPGFYGNATYSYRDPVPFTSDGENVADSYILLNAKLGYRKHFGKFGLDAYAGTNNITGTQYYYMLFLNQLNDAYIPAPLKTFFYGGINLKYNF